ncbi:MAG TPA: replication endonuclease [Noviherbaspirillum sp.]|uniref:replication endonuclease n=1 Tax=Noviherbaspirillum sp. TaxID=1926288 RepID=UPI002B4643BE|nr:replication endonuclease [Noviherbaspirillum sp.]HJV86927.1 replication endonuclease [Noviherbaspirillum sp.]
MLAESYIAGLPRRWGIKLAGMFASEGYTKHAEKMRVVHAVQSEVQRVPLDAGEGALHQAADAAARECYGYCERYKLASLIVDGISLLCLRMGISRPVGATEQEIIARAVDKGWWLRKLRKEHIRRFEHTSIMLGFTSMQADPYVSREAAMRQRAYNAANQKLLESTTVTNGQDEFTLAELAALGVSNKAIRRGELMLRIRGFEEIADSLKHVGMFWTITCPSKFHSVGGANAKYNGATPRDAQAYLCKVWARIRAALKRKGIQPYGFRIAEPHSDGCPHWHMLLFIAPEHETAMSDIVKAHALREDGTEEGAQKNRVKLVRIEAGKGTAAGYIAKYVSKNIDGYGVGDHKAFEDGRTYIVQTDIFGNAEITASERVTYWSQVWGIRQFQQIGGAPVGVWREMRRVAEETVRNAHADVRAAWMACQKIESDDPMIARQADYAEFMKALGGPTVGRRGRVQLARRNTVIEGRYATYQEEKPCGVYHVTNANAVYESVRYQWSRVQPAEVVAAPWTGVNNCTREWLRELEKRSKDNAEILKNQKICSANVVIDRDGDWNGDGMRLKPDIGPMSDYLKHRKNAEQRAQEDHLRHLQSKFKDRNG